MDRHTDRQMYRERQTLTHKYVFTDIHSQTQTQDMLTGMYVLGCLITENNHKLLTVTVSFVWIIAFMTGADCIILCPCTLMRTASIINTTACRGI